MIHQVIYVSTKDFKELLYRRSLRIARTAMGGDHGHSKLVLPDYKQWKVEGTPLEFTQERLARRGLKDPWARNEAWRYMGAFAKPVTFRDACSWTVRGKHGPEQDNIAQLDRNTGLGRRTHTHSSEV
ncbi:NADH dehydrogenase-like [Arapaima gigas]